MSPQEALPRSFIYLTTSFRWDGEGLQSGGIYSLCGGGSSIMSCGAPSRVEWRDCIASRECGAWRLVVLDGDISFSPFQDLDYKIASMLSSLKHTHFCSLVTCCSELLGRNAVQYSIHIVHIISLQTKYDMFSHFLAERTHEIVVNVLWSQKGLGFLPVMNAGCHTQIYNGFWHLLARQSVFRPFRHRHKWLTCTLGVKLIKTYYHSHRVDTSTRRLGNLDIK